MGNGCNIYSPPHARALPRVHTALVGFNMVGITIIAEVNLLDINELNVLAALMDMVDRYN